MNVNKLGFWGSLLLVMLFAAPLAAQQGKGKGSMGKGPQGRGPMGGGQAGDPSFAADRDLFHYLLEHRGDIRREVKKTEQGVETLTESDVPAVAAAIQKHVASMEARVRERRPIHLRDPLFAELFRNAGKIRFAFRATPKGVLVIETSDDPFVVKLIQAHADVVSLFIKNGFNEAQRNHEVPKP